MRRILIVDDEPLIRYSLSAAFRDKETEIIARQDGKSALKAIGDWGFDFCFLDIQLPDMTGIDVVKVIRQLSPRTKVVMMTASAPDDQSMNAIRASAYLFLNKPFDLFRVKRVIDAVTPVDENIFHEFDELESSIAERRKKRRQTTVRSVSYVRVSGGKEEQERSHRGDLLDISDAGTRIRTAYPLEPGNVVKFKNSVNEAAGIVRWASVDKQNGRCLAGIQFIGDEEQ